MQGFKIGARHSKYFKVQMDLHKMYWNLFTSSLKVHVREKVFSFQLDTKHDMKIIGQRLNAMKNNQLF